MMKFKFYVIITIPMSDFGAIIICTGGGRTLI